MSRGGHFSSRQVEAEGIKRPFNYLNCDGPCMKPPVSSCSLLVDVGNIYCYFRICMCLSDYSALALGALTVRVAVDVWRNLPGL